MYLAGAKQRAGGTGLGEESLNNKVSRIRIEAFAGSKESLSLYVAGLVENAHHMSRPRSSATTKSETATSITILQPVNAT